MKATTYRRMQSAIHEAEQDIIASVKATGKAFLVADLAPMFDASDACRRAVLRMRTAQDRPASFQSVRYFLAAATAYLLWWDRMEAAGRQIVENLARATR